MKTTKKALSVLLAVIMIMSSMSVCFGTFSFTASAADDSKIEAFATALKNSSSVLENLYNKSTGFSVNATSSGSAKNTNALTKTTTVTLTNYSDYAVLKNLVARFHEAIMATEEIAKTGSGDAATRTCTSGKHIYIEFEKKLPKYGCTMTDPVVYFLKLVLDDAKARQHDDYEQQKKGWFSSSSSSSTPASLTNTLTIKTTDDAYKGYLASIGAYTNVENPIDLGVKYVFTMGRGYYAAKDGLTTYWRFHNYVSSTPAAPVYNQNKNTEAKSEVDAHATVINNFTSVSFDDLLAKVNNGTIDKFLSDFDAAVTSTQTYVGGASTYNKLFGSFATAVATQKASIQSAKSMQAFLPIVDNYKAFIAANPSYGVFTWGNGGGANNWGAFGEKGSATHAKMEADYNTFKGYYDALVAGGTVLDYFVNNGDIDMQYLYNFTDNYKVYYLNDSRNAADNFYNTYKDTYKDYTTEEQSSLYSEISGYINAIGTYRSNARGGELQVINAIYNEGYVYLLNLQEDLKCEINEYVLYFAENAHKSFIDLTTEEIYDKIQEVKEKKLGLDEFYNTLTYSRRDQLLGQTRTDADNMLDGLYRLLADRFTAQVNAVDAIYTEVGRPTTLDMVKYLKLKGVVVPLEDGWDKLYHAENYDDDANNNTGKNEGIQDYLNNAGKGSYISTDTMTKYNSYFNGIYYEYCRYATTYGFADYKQSHITYEDRDVYADDEVKKDKYSVTEQNLLNTIADLDTIITSDTVSNLLGSLLNEDGSPLDLGAMLSDLVKDLLFKDDFINTVVQLLYPLVLNEFTKAFANLPSEAANMKVTYNKDFHTVCTETGLELFPDLLAGVLDATKYPENVEMLRKAGGYDDSWTSVYLVDTETGKLRLTWGIDEIEDLEEREAKFYEAFDDAVEGLKPLLFALIANQAWNPDSILQFAHAAVLNVTLDIGAKANPGYADMLVPIYELLGVPFTKVSDIEGSTNVAYILEQILAPIFTFLEGLGEKPIDTILEILPDLVYALAFGMAKPLLNKLYTQVWYKAGVIGGGSVTVVQDGVDIYIGDTLITTKDDALLPETMFAGGINSLLSHFGLNLPTIDQSVLATLGELKTVSTARKSTIYSGLSSGQAYTIVADKADVAYYLLSYILGLVQDEAAFTSLLGMFMTQKDENGQPIKVDDKTVPDTEAIEALTATLYDDEGLNLDEIDVGDAIAAIVELANQIEYGVDPYYWYAGENNTPLGTTAAADIYLNPKNDWTEAKAEYLYDNLEALLNSIFTMAGLDISVEGALADALGGLFSNKTVTGLAKLLGSLSDLGALLAPKAEEDAPEASAPETVAEGEEAGLDIASILTDLLKNELGIDLSIYAPYANLADDAEIDFGVTDAASFVAALTELLAPLKPVLDFILGGEDLTLIDSAITLHGYKGYDNAIIPLLEALGAAPAAYTEGADTLALTLNALVGVINKLTTNDPDVAKDGAIYTIIDMLPGVIYYLSSNGLSQGIDKLLTPVYAILDTIRPIYNLNLAEMIKAIEVDFDKDGVKEPLGLDIKNINWSFIFGLLNDLLGLDLSALQQVIYDVCDDIATTYTSASKLNSAWKKGAYNANFSQADMLTVILSFVLEWASVKENAEKLDELLKTNGLISSITGALGGIKVNYATPDWMYWFKTEEEFKAYVNGDKALPDTLAALAYPNDWNEETAKYLAENLASLVDMVIALINKDDAEAPKTLSALLTNLLNGFVNDQTMNDLVAMITSLLANIDETLIDTVGVIIDADIAGLKDYNCTAGIDSLEDFAIELGRVLDTYAGRLVQWIFFDDSYEFARTSTNNSTIVLNGGKGYEKGLALILEALGCEKLPTSRSATEVLKLLAARVTQILAKPVDEILAILPNLVYFLNANGAGVAVSNMLAPIVNLLDALAIENVKLDLADLIKITKDDGTVVKLNLGALTLANIVNFVEELTGLNLVAVENLLVDFCVGKIVNYGSISEMPTFKMVADKADVVTIVLTTALAVINTEGNADVIGVEIIKNIKKVFNNAPVTYVTPNWDYCWDKEDINYVEGTIGVIESALTYPNDWTEEKSVYLAGHLSSLVDTVVKMVTKNDEATLATIIDEKVNIYTPDLLKTIQTALGDLLGGLDEDIQALVNVGFGAADKLLGADVQGLLEYDVSGVKDKETFVAALTGMLMEVEGLVDWLLLGEDYKLFVDDKNNDGKYDKGEDIITLNGAHGYAEGLALLLEALGCEDLPEVYDVENLDTEAVVSAVLTSLANRIDEVLDNPIDEALDLLPNLIYFLNTNGVAAVIDNLTGAFTALATKLKGFGLNLDLNALINIPKLMKIEGKGATISLDNLAMKDILQAVSLMLDLDLTVLEGTLNGFALGNVQAYPSVSRKDVAFKMGYKNEFDKHDMITVLVTALLLVVETEGNAESLEKLLGENIYDALMKVFAGGNVAYAKPNWDYDQTKYTVEYPNNWTETTAEEVTKFLLSKDFDKLITGLIDKNYASLGDLLTAKVDVFTTENLNALVKIINDLLSGIDAGLIEGAGILLDAKLVGEKSLATYTAPEGIKTVKAFAKELAKVLTTYAPGVVEWLLLGQDYRFFVNDANGDAEYTYGEDIITISGANGYTEGLALLLEALGVAAPAVIKDAEGNIDTAETVKAVLVALADRIEVILGNPVVEIINLLPNLFYFLNTNGVAAVVDNTLAAVFALLGKLEAFGVELNINDLVNLKKLMGLEGTEAAISLDNLSMAAVLEAVGLMVGLDLTYIEKVLVGFGLGTVKTYESVSTQAGTPKKMIYTTDFANYDMVTVLANLVLITIADAKNAEFVKELAGEEIYAVILKILNLEKNEAPVQNMNWQGVPDKVGQIFNALETSPTYKGFEYGPLYTKEMAQYIADNIGEFINNIIYLLGLEINGVNVDSLESLLNNLVGGSLYNSDLVITLRDALAGLAGSIEGLEVNGVNVGKTIVTVLKTAKIADLKKIGTVEVPAFEDDKTQFVESICDVLEPAYGLLTWLLADEDLAFFVDVDKSDFITLPGAEGYRNGIGLLLEAIGCEPTALAEDAEGEELVKAILNPLLNRLDEIFANPAEEILAVLTNVIYFINSNGIDVVIKNTLNAVYTVLNAIEPIAEVDLYELVGLDAYVTLSAEELIDMLLSKLEVAGFDFTAVSVDLFSELTIGKLTQYTSISAEGAEAYKMVYDAQYADEADMVTAVMRLVITFILTDNNREVLVDLLKDVLGMSADAEKYVRALLKAFADNVVGKKGEDLRLGMDSVLATIYYIFYGLDTGVDNTVAGKKDLDKLWAAKIKELNDNSPSENTQVGDLITDIFDIIFNDEGKIPEGGGNDVADKEEIAPNGFIAFFQRIAKFFEEIGEFFRNLFSFGK